MTQEQKTKIEEHYDRLYSIAVGLTPNIPDDIRDTMRAAYVAGADYALDIYCPQWISVEDRRPKLKHKYENTQCSEKVIVTDGKYRTSASWVHNIWAGWYGWFADGDEELIGITHWMPMPQAPTCSEKPNNCEKGGEE